MDCTTDKQGVSLCESCVLQQAVHLWNAVVQNKANVGGVDSHPERSIGGDDDLDSLLAPTLVNAQFVILRSEPPIQHQIVGNKVDIVRFRLTSEMPA